MRAAAALAAAYVALVAVAAASPTGRKPALHVTSVAPLTVRGEGFHSLERVTVLLAITPSKIRRIVEATPRGTFRVVFPVFKINRCSQSSALSASGDRGSRVFVKLARLACPRR